MVIDFVGATGPLLGIAQGDIADEANALGQADRPDKALAQAMLLELIITHEVVALAEEVLGLAVVELVVTGNDGDDGIPIRVDERERLTGAAFRGTRRTPRPRR